MKDFEKMKRLDIIDSECLLCSHTKAQICQVFTPDEVVKHLKIEEKENKYDILKDHVENIWNSKFCYFVKCLDCKFEFAVPYVAGDLKFYNLVYDKNIKYPEWKWDFEITNRTIEKIVHNVKYSNLKLFEIGAGEGNFVKKIAPNLLPKKNILTTEYSSFGKNEINNYGIECLAIDICDIRLDKYKEGFDFICMFQVLEHLDKLDKVFHHISQLMKKKSHLFITVPNNIHRQDFEEYGVIEDIPPVHIGRWNKKSFEILAEKFGLKIVKHKIEPTNIKRNILKYFSLKPMKSSYISSLSATKNKYLRKIFKLLILFLFIIFNLKAIIKLNKKNHGVSQWIHLIKQ